jgi:Uma2 family endonuclease
MGTTVTMTLAEFAVLPDRPGKQELLNGELIAVPPPKLRHARIQRRVIEMLSAYVKEHGGGEVLTGVGFRISPNSCLEPDVAFVNDEQLAQTDPDGWFGGAPALAVEILSPSNSAAEMDDKVQLYLGAGAVAVWVINPRRQRLTTFYRDGTFETIDVAGHGIIREGRLFPGLSVPLSTLFEGL